MPAPRWVTAGRLDPPGGLKIRNGTKIGVQGCGGGMSAQVETQSSCFPEQPPQAMFQSLDAGRRGGILVQKAIHEEEDGRSWAIDAVHE